MTAKGTHKPSKLDLVESKAIVPGCGVESLAEYCASAACASCGLHWVAKNQEVLLRFYFSVPGGWSEFVCPACRKLVSVG